MKILFYILMVFYNIGIFTQIETKFEEGNTLYNQGKYAEAIDIYSTILDTENHSAALYFNLANAHYKLNNIAPSIYFYEKARQLSPHDKDIKNNMAFAKNMTIDAIEVIPETGVSKLINNVTNLMSFDNWAKASVVVSICFVILFLIYYFAHSTLKKRLAFMGSIVLLFFLSITLTLAFHKYNLTQKNKPAIIFAQESKVKSEPNSRSEESFRLHEGTKVQILDTINNWKKIKLSDGKTGWISNEDIKAI